jgi:hypothetical protein
MPQLTASQARVIDPVLTSVAQGYTQPGLVGGALFPRVAVQQRGGKIISFSREDMKQYSLLARAPGSNTQRVQFGYSSSSYTLDDYSIEGVLPVENMQEAAAVPGIDMSALTLMKAMEIIQLRLEIQQATLATTAASYQAANKVTLSGTSQWSDQTTGVSNPMKNIETAKEAVRAATGRRANTVVMGAAVYAQCRTHPLIVDRIKYTGREIATPELLAALFGVDQVLIGDGVYSNDAETSFTDVWGKFVVVAYTIPQSAAQQGAPTYGYTYTLDGYPIAEAPYFERSSKSWIFPASGSEKPVITQVNAGYLISAAVA